jgi:hypothetical protein
MYTYFGMIYNRVLSKIHRSRWEKKRKSEKNFVPRTRIIPFTKYYGSEIKNEIKPACRPNENPET